MVNNGEASFFYPVSQLVFSKLDLDLDLDLGLGLDLDLNVHFQ